MLCFRTVSLFHIFVIWFVLRMKNFVFLPIHYIFFAIAVSSLRRTKYASRSENGDFCPTLPRRERATVSRGTP